MVILPYRGPLGPPLKLFCGFRPMGINNFCLFVDINLFISRDHGNIPIFNILSSHWQYCSILSSHSLLFLKVRGPCDNWYKRMSTFGNWLSDNRDQINLYIYMVKIFGKILTALAIIRYITIKINLQERLLLTEFTGHKLVNRARTCHRCLLVNHLIFCDKYEPDS